MESLPVEVSLKILRRVISSSRTPSTLYKLLSASPNSLRIFLAHRHNLLDKHISDLNAAIEKDIIGMQTLAKKDEQASRRHVARYDQSTFPTRITCEELMDMFSGARAIKDEDDAMEAWSDIMAELQEKSMNREMFGLPVGDMENILEMVQQIRWALDAVGDWESFLNEFMMDD